MASLVLTFTLILSAGFLPALLWLWLVLKEDRVHPEPRLRLTLSFLAGMGAVVAVLPFQGLVQGLRVYPVMATILFAASEEISKFFFSYMSALRSKDADEPIDEVIYMATTALGFAALENCLFIAQPFINGDIPHALIIAHIRFLGSTLVHVAASSIIGMYLAKAFYKTNKKKAIIMGLILAITLHSTYNFLIISLVTTSVLNVFIGLWLVCFTLVLVLNHIKQHFSHE